MTERTGTPRSPGDDLEALAARLSAETGCEVSAVYGVMLRATVPGSAVPVEASGEELLLAGIARERARIRLARQDADRLSRLRAEAAG